jgi:hypothetical protein
LEDVLYRGIEMEDMTEVAVMTEMEGMTEVEVMTGMEGMTSTNNKVR